MAKTNAIGNKTSALTINEAYTFPTTDGTANYVLVTNGAGTVTWDIAASGLVYEEVIDISKQMEVNRCYGAKNSLGVTFILPATSAVGDIVQVVGILGVWTINQWTDQQICYGVDSTTVGGTGILTSIDVGDCITLECIVANKVWRACCGWGNFNKIDNVLRVWAGYTNSYMIRASGTAWGWGYGFLVGDNDVTNKVSPVAIAGSPMFSTQYEKDSQFFCLAKKVDGSLWTWGYASDGILGDNTTTNKTSPVQVVGSHKFVTAARTFYYALALKSDGSIWGWGRGTSGQLGNNSTSNRSSPVTVTGNHSFISISVGQSTSIGLKADGNAWCFGDNTYGQLGDNSKTTRSSPVLVVGSHSFTSILSVGSTSYGLKANGEVWGWGRNNYGQLGDQTATDKSSPVLMVGSHSFIEIRGKTDSHFVGFKANGTVWACGNNNSGQLGDYSTTNRSSPVAVVGSHSFISVVGDRLNSVFGLKASGQVWGWGLNDNGQLGDNSTNNRSSPVLVVGSHSFTYISSVNFHILALKANNEIWAWGKNDLGQLGDGSGTNRSSPVLVQGSPW